MDRIEQTISSVEVAEMVGKAHNKLMRDIREYIDQLAQSNLGHDEFFNESTYVDNNNRTRPCYQITKKGCEFIAHKLTGIKGTEFTARYIERFHDIFDFGTKRLDRFKKRFNDKTECLETGNVTWIDMIEQVREENNIKLDLRKNDVVMAWRKK